MLKIGQLARLLVEQAAQFTVHADYENPQTWLRSSERVPSVERQVVFVCTGNICRSPFAAVLARSRGIPAISCGTNTTNGRAADAAAMEVAASRGIDLRSHRTTRWEDADLHAGDVIVAAQIQHVQAVKSRAAALGCPIVTMTALLRPRLDVVWDPYGKERSAYEDAFDKIEKVVSRIQTLAGNGSNMSKKITDLARSGS